MFIVILISEVYLKHYRLPDGKACFNNLYNQYRSGAKIRNLDFNLTKEECHYLFQQNCFYCNALPNNIYRKSGSAGEYIYNGIDRIDSKLGYQIDNVVPCCKVCNYAKRDMPISEFLTWIKAVYEKSIILNRLG